MIIARRRRKKKHFYNPKTSFFLARTMISALFSNSNPEKNPAFGRIFDYPPPLVRERGKTRGGDIIGEF